MPLYLKLYTSSEMRNRVAGEGEEGVIGCNYHQPINSEVEERGGGGGGGLKGDGGGGGGRSGLTAGGPYRVTKEEPPTLN